MVMGDASMRRFRGASPFRYPGAKSKAAEALRYYRPLGAVEYREPFVGGGSMFFELGFCFERVWLNDLHRGLMSVYEARRDRPDEFIGLCRDIPAADPNEPMTALGPRGGAPKNARLKAAFDKIKLDEEADQALRYYIVNRMAYGSGRVNYEIPSRLGFGSHAGWNVVATDKLEQAAAALQGVRLTCGDYRVLLEEPGEDVFVFCDSPYVVNSYLPRSSQLYQHSFTEQDHYDFAGAVKACPHKVMVTYDDDEDGLVRSLFPKSDFWIEVLGWAYSGTTEKKKRRGRELLILNYEPMFAALRN